MALLFNEYGNLTPDKAIVSNKTEIEDVFVYSFPESRTRQNLFNTLIQYIQDLNKILISNDDNLRSFILIDGSFVTKKENPNDIDLVVFVDYMVFQERKNDLSKFKCDYSQPKGLLAYPGIHAFMVEMYPETHKKYLVYQADYLQWLVDDFGKDRKGRRKGMLQLFTEELL